jgi:rhodanese-related sulfurtransferase
MVAANDMNFSWFGFSARPVSFRHYDDSWEVTNMNTASISMNHSISNSNAVSDTAAVETAEVPAVLRDARAHGVAEQLRYAGKLSPVDAWQLFASGEAVLIDVRTSEERKFVGHVPGSTHVAWMTGIAMTKNPRFVRELEAKVKKHEVVLLLCRSGKRSADAAEAATKAAFSNAFNVSEGFEGDLDDQGRRGGLGGWRFHDLPWVQD